LKQRGSYFIISIFVIILGILSRKIEFIPLFIGDILYAILIYFGFCILFPNKSSIKIFIFSLFFCFTIELSQLIRWNWLNTIRSTTLGHYVLGEGFIWTDLLCYVIGNFMAYYLDKSLLKNKFY